MPEKPFSKRNIVREALDKNPSVESKTLARQLARKYPQVWSGIEQARDTVRYVRGAHGKIARTAHVGKYKREPIEVPKGDESDWRVHELPSYIKKWLVISDIHCPYHSHKALKLALECGRDEGCDGVLINGDGIDFYQMSKFEKDPRKRDPLGEVVMMNRILDSIEKVGAKEIWYKCGNHDARLPRYLMQSCAEAFELIDVHCNIGTILKLEQRGIKFIPSMHPMRCKELSIVHGHEWGAGVFNPVNPARGAFLRALACILVSHSHRTSEHPEANILDVILSSYSTGCLCQLHPDYRALGNRWNHGFAILEAGKGWSIKNKKIIGEKKIT